MGVAPQRPEAGEEVVHLVVREGEAELAVGPLEGSPSTLQQVHGLQAGRLGVLEEPVFGLGEVGRHDLGHAVVEEPLDDRQ